MLTQMIQIIGSSTNRDDDNECIIM